MTETASRSKNVLLYLLHVLNDGYYTSLQLLMPFIAVGLGLNLVQVGILGTTTSSLGIVLAIPSGYLAARWGGLRAIMLAMMFYLLGYLGTALSPSFIFLMPSFFLAGAGFGLFHPIAFAQVSKWAPKSERGQKIGDFSAVGDVGRVGLSTLMPTLAVLIGWRQSALAYVAAGSICFVVLLSVLRRQNTHGVIAKKVAPKVSFHELMTNTRFVLTLCVGGLDQFASASLFLFLSFVLIQKGISKSVLGLFTAAFGLGYIVGKMTLGRVVTRHRAAKVFVAAELCMALFIVLLTSSTNFVIILLVAFVLGGLTMGTVPVIQTMLTEAVEQHQTFEKAYGIYMFVISAAGTLAPLMIGIVAKATNILVAFNVCAGFGVLATVPAVLVMLSARTREKI